MPRLIAPSKDESALLPPFLELPDHAIHVPQTEAECEVALQALRAEPMLGFDTESKPLFHVGQTDSGPHLVQLATLHEAWLLQLHLPWALELSRWVLAASHICKVGFGLDNDKHSLPRKLETSLVNIQDLDSRFKQLGYGASVGVRAASALVLHQNFRKSKRITTSNWAAKELSAAQRRYAANDAHAPAVIHANLPEWESTFASQTRHRAARPSPQR